jgi:hypothetical protein
MDRPAEFPAPMVQIVGPTDNWILQKLSKILVSKLPYASFSEWRPSQAGHLAYYMNYALFHAPSGLIDVGFFTHREDSHEFLTRAQQMDCCVCMARTYADWLRDRTTKEVIHIPMGYDACRYRPSLVLGVIGKLEHPRKGRHLVEHLRSLPFVEFVTTEGGMPEQSLREIYQRVDYVLIPALIEGGPMSLLEGLAMGKPVIAPDSVGMIPEFSDCFRIHLYPTGDVDALSRLVEVCYQRKLAYTNSVANRSWDQWAIDHHNLFTRLLANRGFALPVPGPGFRFGMMTELLTTAGAEIPRSTDLSELETTIDQAAAFLYYGRSRNAMLLLENAERRFPFVRSLIAALRGF